MKHSTQTLLKSSNKLHSLNTITRENYTSRTYFSHFVHFSQGQTDQVETVEARSHQRFLTRCARRGPEATLSSARGNCLHCEALGHRAPIIEQQLTCVMQSVFFLLVAAWVRSRAERPSVSYTKVSAVSLGLANSCNYTNRNKFKQNSGSNKFQIAGDGKMKRMREP